LRIEEDGVEFLDLDVESGAGPVQQRVPVFFLENHKWRRFFLIKTSPCVSDKFRDR
jgi:hypothetical protein